MKYAGITKGELLALWANVPDDAPLYVFTDPGCAGLNRIVGAQHIPAGDDEWSTDVAPEEVFSRDIAVIYMDEDGYEFADVADMLREGGKE